MENRNSHPGKSKSRKLGLLSSLTLLLLSLPLSNAATRDPSKKPIILDSSGGFEIGGKVLTNPKKPNETLSCDHGYVEYFLPWTPRKTSLVMWHSSSTQVYQNRWDGGEGYKDKFLRRDYPVYLWDGPRVGRANYGCENITYVPWYRDQANFANWNFGPKFKNWWPDVQFPTEDEYAWQQATSARYDEMDTEENVQLHGYAMSVAADSGKLGERIVYVTNSAGGYRAQLAATMSKKNNIAGIVAYECIGYVYPDNVNITAGKWGFGPTIVPLEDFKRLAKLTAIQFIWGDHRQNSTSFVQDSWRAAALINQYGGNAQVFVLGNDTSFKGNTHIAFADMNNDQVAGALDDFLAKNNLDGYVDNAKV
ncbi:hypothetical protein G7Y89_g10538 [Cudoniella acicularis]|uniref:Uncharacterized protein n=1 Tax=Cudoniella acicularis TaxID=354080 RepID=A0A8H4W1I4_9HELO|nr:hypothetical protein G7Y89_g10538 [Cudoniella acicularis]